MQQQPNNESSITSDDNDIPELVHAPLTGWENAFVFPVVRGFSATSGQVDATPSSGLYDGLYILSLAALSDRMQLQQQKQPDQSRP